MQRGCRLFAFPLRIVEIACFKCIQGAQFDSPLTTRLHGLRQHPHPAVRSASDHEQIQLLIKHGRQILGAQFMTVPAPPSRHQTRRQQNDIFRVGLAIDYDLTEAVGFDLWGNHLNWVNRR
jgi:hypothetical protein